MARLTREEIEALSVAERVQLIEEIWESIEAQPELLPITDAQRAELDRRLAHLEANPSDGIPWEEVRRKLDRGR